MAAERDPDLRFDVFKVGVRLGCDSTQYQDLLELAGLVEAGDALRSTFYETLAATEGMTYVEKDSLCWPLLSREEREFMEDRGFTVAISAIGSEIAAPPNSHFNGARFELDDLLAPWGGCPIFIASPHRRKGDPDEHR